MIDMVLCSNFIQVFNTKKVLRLSNLAIDLKETRFLMKKKKKKKHYGDILYGG